MFHYLDSLKARKVQPSRTQFFLAKKPGITSNVDWFCFVLTTGSQYELLKVKLYLISHFCNDRYILFDFNHWGNTSKIQFNSFIFAISQKIQYKYIKDDTQYSYHYYNVPTKLFTRSNVLKPRKPI